MVDQIIEEIKKNLTGEPEKDINYLQEQGIKYRNHPDAVEILKVLSDLSFDLLPEKSKEEFNTVMFIDGKRLDQVYNDAITAMKENNLDGAIEIMEKLEDKADKHFDLENAFSFRNRLDEHLYAHIYKPEKRYVRTPFDLCKFFSAHGYMLIEKRKPEEAVKKLEKAVRYNPVNTEPRFELCEAYKIMHQPENLMKSIREMMPICVTPYHLARCYANLGYYCVEIKDYDGAVAFYFASLFYAQNPAIQGELQHISILTQKEIKQPTKDELNAILEKYNITNGASQDTINLIYSLGSYCMEHNAPPEESMFYMQLVYDLTRSEKVQDTLDMLKAQIAARNARVKQ